MSNVWGRLTCLCKSTPARQRRRVSPDTAVAYPPRLTVLFGAGRTPAAAPSPHRTPTPPTCTAEVFINLTLPDVTMPR